MSDFLAPNGAPYCYDEPADWHAGDTLADVCEDCPIAYQADMLLAHRCFPPDPDNTAVGRTRARVSAANLRAILAQHRVGFPSDRLQPWYQR